MFKPAAIRITSIIAMMLCGTGLLFSAWLSSKSVAAIPGCASWAILLWAGYLGFRLTSYKLQQDEFKKVAFRIYLIIGAALISWFTGVLIGIVISVILLSTLYSLKSNYDSWVEIPLNNNDSSPDGRRPMR